MREAASSGVVPDVRPPNTKEDEAALRPMCAQLKASDVITYCNANQSTSLFVPGGPICQILKGRGGVLKVYSRTDPVCWIELCMSLQEDLVAHHQSRMTKKRNIESQLQESS